MARKTVLSNFMLVIYGVLIFWVLAYGVGSVIYYYDPHVYVLLDWPKKHHAWIEVIVGMFVELAFFIFIAVIALLRGVYEEAKIEALQKQRRS